MKNENLRLSIYILFDLALSFTVLFGCGGDDTSIDHTIIIHPVAMLPLRFRRDARRNRKGTVATG